jgi:hypothetical protein
LKVKSVNGEGEGTELEKRRYNLETEGSPVNARDPGFYNLVFFFFFCFLNQKADGTMVSHIQLK